MTTYQDLVLLTPGWIKLVWLCRNDDCDICEIIQRIHLPKVTKPGRLHFHMKCPGCKEAMVSEYLTDDLGTVVATAHKTEFAPFTQSLADPLKN